MGDRDDEDLTISITATIETHSQTFKVRLAGVSHDNDDGTSRQALLARCKPGERVELRREPDNAYDPYAIAVHRTSGEQIGYIPAGDRRLAEHIDRGGEVAAHIVVIDGRAGWLGRLLGRAPPHYGCVIQVEKGDFDWKRVTPYLELDRAASALVRKAKQHEKDDPKKALKLYRKACDKIHELDQQGPNAQKWRTTRHPINRISLILARNHDYDGAVQAIRQYQASVDPVPINKADDDAIAKRRARLERKVE